MNSFLCENSMKITAVVVSFNRFSLLLETVASLLAQTLKLDSIIIVDNCSSEKGYESLKIHPLIAGNKNISVYRLDKNTGGSGGFNFGMDQAYQSGADWIWVMDDDAEPKNDCLQRMVQNDFFGKNDCLIVAPKKVGIDGLPQYEHRGFFWNKNKIEPLTDADYKVKYIYIDYCSFVGPLISSLAIKKYGLPDKRFFIWYDDVEFCLRVSKREKILLCNDAIIVHKDGAAAKKNKIGLAIMPINLYWKSLCGARNYMFLMKHRVGKGVAWLLWNLFKRHVKILIFEDRKNIRMKYLRSVCLPVIFSDTFFDVTPSWWKSVLENEEKNKDKF